MSAKSKAHEIIEDPTPDATQNRIELAWKLILEQYFIHSKKVSQEKGPGMSVFHLLRQPKEGDFNCEYFYAEKDSMTWKMLLEMSPDRESISEHYDPNTTLIICIQIPIGLSGYSTIGNMKLISIETGKEFEEDTSIEPKISADQSLHKRHIKI